MRKPGQVAQHPPAVVSKVYNLYMESMLTVPQIAEATDVGVECIRRWITRKRWSIKRQELYEEMQVNIDAERRHIVMKNLPKVMKRHLELTASVDNAAAMIINQSMKKNSKGVEKTDLSSRDISDLGKGINQAAAVSARVVGLDKSSAIANDTPGISVGSGSLVQIGLMPISAAPASNLHGDVIDVEAIEKPIHSPLTDFPEA